ncbi:MAG TPA: DUF1549 domain-containing protein [Acidobacteriota bacterium]
MLLPRVKGTAMLLVAAAIAWVSVEALPHSGNDPADGPTITPGVADCTFYPGHEQLYLSNPTQERDSIAIRLKEVSSFLPQTNSFATPASKNYIDNFIFDKMARDKVTPADLCTDSEFIRRVYIDATGRVPTADKVTSFLNDQTPSKRDVLVDSLLGTPEYADRWANFMGDRLDLVMQSTQINLYQDARNAWYNYVRDSIAQNKPFNQFVTELITGAGDNRTNGAANFFVRWRQPNGPIQDTYDNLATATGEMLGLSLNCISCHDGAGHTNSINLYLTDRTRYDLWTLAAFYSRTALTNPQRGPNNNNVIGWTVADNTNGSYILNTTTGNKTPRASTPPNQAVLPKYLTDSGPSDAKGPNTGETYRAAVARMTTSDHQFARATVNYLWKELFGLGIVEPTDNFDLYRIKAGAALPDGWTMQANQPELLEALATDFEQHNYDLKYMIGTIMKSATYQLSSNYSGTWSDQYIPYYARKFPRRLKSEEIMDIITQVTNQPASYTPSGYTQPVNWAMQLPDPDEPNNNFLSRKLLDTFLRGNRDDRPRSSEGSISQALVLLNDPFVTTRVKTTAANSTVANLFANKSLSPVNMVTQLYLTTLSRQPSTDELNKSVAYLGNPVSASKLEDLQFALINKVDFMFNY